MNEEQAREIFVHELRRVLQNLYDPAVLRKSQLLALFALETRPNPASSLRDVFLNAIHTVKPPVDVPIQSNAWRIYHVLTYRYIEQTHQQMVAANMALSVRQLRRLERDAEQMLADTLWQQYHVRWQDLADVPLQAETAVIDQAEAEGELAPNHGQELEWLRESFPNEISGIPELVASVLKVIQPLIQAEGMQLKVDMADNLPPVSGKLTAMRQALLNLLTASVRAVSGGQLKVAARLSPEGVWVSLEGYARPGRGVEIEAEHSENIEMVRQFIELFDGKLEIQKVDACSPRWETRLLFPTAAQAPVLVIDDNADILHLFQRYLSGTPFLFLGARDAVQAFHLVEETLPQVIVLDVMMPGIEDWELLGRIRAHPRLREVPVIICTILPQETLARALGASGFLRKPVSRQTFLNALERMIHADKT